MNTELEGMRRARVGEAGIALIGLYALIIALVKLPSAINIAISMGTLLRATDSFGALEWSYHVRWLSSILLSFAGLIPGVVVIVARHRLGAWLLPVSESGDESLSTEVMLRIGLILLGVYFVVASASSIPVFFEIDYQIEGVEFELKRGLYSLVRPLVRFAAGLALMIYSVPLSRRLSRTA